jgi:hypothetical protein
MFKNNKIEIGGWQALPFFYYKLTNFQRAFAACGTRDF